MANIYPPSPHALPSDPADVLAMAARYSDVQRAMGRAIDALAHVRPSTMTHVHAMERATADYDAAMRLLGDMSRSAAHVAAFLRNIAVGPCYVCSKFGPLTHNGMYCSEACQTSDEEQD